MREGLAGGMLAAFRPEVPMPIVMSMQWPGIQVEDYERVRKQVNWEGQPAPGGLAHIAWFSDGKLHVTDVWTTPEQFQDFTNRRLMPAVRQTGITTEPNVAVLPMHALFIPELHARKAKATRSAPKAKAKSKSKTPPKAKAKKSKKRRK